jgi:O-antigen ligase
MRVGQIIRHKTIAIGTLMLAVVALPFSITVCHAAIIFFLVLWAAEGDWRNKFSIVSSSLLVQLLIVLFLWQLVGLAFSDDLNRGWFSIEKKIFFLLVPVALATSTTKLAEKDVKLILTAFTTACLVGTMVCLYGAWKETRLVMEGSSAINPYLANSAYFQLHGSESASWLLFSYVSLANGIGLHPTYFSLYLAFSVAFVLNELPSAATVVRKAALIALALYFTTFIVFLSSRIIILALAAILFSVLINGMVRKRRSIAAMALGMVVTFASLLFLNPVTQYRSLEEIDYGTFRVEPGKNYTNAAHIRFSLWWLAVKSIGKSNPLIGEGTGDVEKLMTATSTKFNITNVIGSFDPHNEYLYTMLANGAPGLFLLLLCLALPAWWAWLQKDFLLLGFTFIFSLVCVTESALELQKGIAFYSLFSGLLFFQLHSFQNVSIKLRSLLRVGQ